MNDFREYNNYLMHYGIPGQRYGIMDKEADRKRENRVQHIEDKITRAEEKVKSIFKKWGF